MKNRALQAKAALAWARRQGKEHIDWRRYPGFTFAFKNPATATAFRIAFPDFNTIPWRQVLTYPGGSGEATY